MDGTRETNTRYTRKELWDIYCEIGLSERHFNTVQEKYRLLASSWLLATVAAGSYLIANESDFEPLSGSCLAASLAFMGSVGISLLWILDVKVYQRLLSSYYAEGLMLEDTQVWLPMIRLRIRNHFKGSVPLLISIYYIGSTLFLNVLGCMAVGLFLAKESASWPWEPKFPWQSDFVTSLVLGTLSVATVLAMIVLSRQPKGDLTSVEMQDAKHADDQRRLHYKKAIVESETHTAISTSVEVP